ncbi:TetR/AcrR family transcriptional regulator [Gordonia aurantiaca]|uniref:TetR/AcrR family transcriptional regulator n=1 Tax=Gordonia sp. B21 TaxID=3151852 RepID=UPI003264280D
MTAERTYAGRPVSDRAAERRRRFLDAALAEFSGPGYSKSSVTSICRAAGLSRRQFYEEFSDREELLIALYDEIQHAARDAVVEALSRVEATDRRELATAAMTAYMESVGTDPRRAEVSFVQIVGVSPRVEQHRLDGREEWVDFFVAAMAEFAGRPRDERRKHLAIAYVGALTSIVHRWSVSPQPAPIPEIVSVLADILVAFADL